MWLAHEQGAVGRSARLSVPVWILWEAEKLAGYYYYQPASGSHVGGRAEAGREGEGMKNGIWKWVATGAVSLLTVLFSVWLLSVQGSVASADANCKERHKEMTEATHQIDKKLGQLETKVENLDKRTQTTNKGVTRIENILLNQHADGS